MRPRKKPYTWRRASEGWISRTLTWDEREGGRGAPKDGIAVNAQRAALHTSGSASPRTMRCKAAPPVESSERSNIFRGGSAAQEGNRVYQDEHKQSEQPKLDQRSAEHARAIGRPFSFFRQCGHFQGGDQHTPD